MDALIIGCGYVGQRVARRWVEEGHQVHALTRSPARSAEFARSGIRAVVGDVMDPPSLQRLPSAEVLLYAVGHDRTSGIDKHAVAIDGLRNVLQQVAGRVPRIVFISSVSVYGQSDGSWIDEDSSTTPESEGGRICLEAEVLFRETVDRAGIEGCILRLAGIYGPERLLARMDALQAGLPLAGRPDSWLNLIHADDAATVAIAAATHPSPDPVYVVSDDRPVTRGEYFSRLADLAGARAPTFDSTETPRHGNGLNKRCRNTRMHESLQISLQYPTLIEGLPNAIGCGAP